MKKNLDLLRQFARGFADGLVTIDENDEFAYYYDDCLIEVAWPEDENPENEGMKDLFITYIKAQYNIDLSDEADYFVFSFLHELGHHMTMDYLTKEELLRELVLRRVIQLLGTEKTNRLYYNLPSEVAANDFASEWFNEKSVEDLKKKLRG